MVELTKQQIVDLNIDEKIQVLERIAERILSLQEEVVAVSGKYSELNAEIRLLKEARSALQSSIRAQMQLDMR